MKLIKLLFISASLAVTLSGCFEDKGNYDYKDLTRIDMDPSGSTYTVPIRGTLKITPDYTFSKEDSNKDLSYLWTLDGEVISTDPVLEWVADRYTEKNTYNLLLEITDNKTDIVYRCVYGVSVLEPYDGIGFFLLSQKDGKRCAHMIKEDFDEEGYRYYNVLTNIYSLENEGATLPSNAFKLYEHYALEKTMGSSSKKVINQFMFVSPDQVTEVKPGSFKDVNTKPTDLFGGGYPGGLKIADVHFMQFLDMITDEEGRLYTRIKTTNEFFHVDEFLPTPTSFDGEELRGIELIPSALPAQHCLLYDKNKKRLLIIWDFKDYNGKYSVGKIENVNSSLKTANVSWPQNTPTIEEAFANYEVIHLSSFRTEFSTWGEGAKTYYFSVLKDPETGKLYHYQFALEQDYNSAIMHLASTSDGKMVDVEYVELSAEAAALFDNPQNVIFTLPTNYLGYGYNGYLTLIGQGNSLYVYNRIAATTNAKASVAADESDDDDPSQKELTVRLLCTFDSEIACMASTHASNYWGEILGVALKNGSVEVLSVKNAQYTIWNGRIWKSEGVDLGEPVSLIYSVGNPGVDWN
ncbi:PKD-like family lipoprotein [Bacteroides bouchesdurhonensis]|uniref:PKD-like family lipoprotein n=1 Tax=Bacteroides bouchesdurhonensis TaxID=1841855 RepID=UPI0009F9D169|nr:PKD-like family lipoprotein [Bacteroides bouchesdurhonensis]